MLPNFNKWKQTHFNEQNKCLLCKKMVKRSEFYCKACIAFDEEAKPAPVDGKPTDFPPGSKEKIEVLAMRVKANENLFPIGDSGNFDSFDEPTVIEQFPIKRSPWGDEEELCDSEYWGVCNELGGGINE